MMLSYFLLLCFHFVYRIDARNVRQVGETSKRKKNNKIDSEIERKITKRKRKEEKQLYSMYICYPFIILYK